MPILNAAGELVGMEILDELLAPEARENTVVLMAGGLGERLTPLTEQCPKPMLQVGGRPILETILLNFTDYGFKRFYISVNHKADVITQHFGDGSSWGRTSNTSAKINVSAPRSAVALTSQPDLPLIVMNADILTKVNSVTSWNIIRYKSKGNYVHSSL